MLSLESAINVFLHSFALNRSIARPAEVAQLGPFSWRGDTWRCHSVRDVARQLDARREEIVVSGNIPAGAIVAAVAEYGPVSGYMLDVYLPAGDDTKPVIQALKALGYRFQRSEPLMVRSTRDVPEVSEGVRVMMVETQVEAERADRAAGTRQWFPWDQEERNRSINVYFVEEDAEYASWGRSIFCRPEGSYVAGMYTQEQYRRRGLATQVLRAMLAGDAQAGAEYSVLLATRAGEQLYLSVGYERVGTLLMFTPVKKG